MYLPDLGEHDLHHPVIEGDRPESARKVLCRTPGIAVAVDNLREVPSAHWVLRISQPLMDVVRILLEINNVTEFQNDVPTAVHRGDFVAEQEIALAIRKYAGSSTVPIWGKRSGGCLLSISTSPSRRIRASEATVTWGQNTSSVDHWAWAT
jgi:hypothetical protein